MSDFPQSPQDPYVSPQAVEKPGMSSGAKLLLILGILFLLCALVCCGGIAIVGYQASAYMEDAVSADPVTIEQRRAELLDMSVPEGFAPEVSVDMKVPMTDSRLMTIVTYQSGPGNSLVLVGVGDMLSDMPKEQMEQEIENSLQQQGIGQPTPGTEWNTADKEFEIGGKPTKFIYRTAKNEDGEPTQFHVTGTVDGKRGPALVIISANAETLSEEEIDQVIESIK
jgi:hypothetical protein